MRTREQWLEYKRLELIPLDESDLAEAQSGVLARLRQLWRSLMTALQQSTEPQIWQSPDQYGNMIWNAYDPTTNREFQWNTDEEVRIWLEERYYANLH